MKGYKNQTYYQLTSARFMTRLHIINNQQVNQKM